jgi:molecular chaperone HscB
VAAGTPLRFVDASAHSPRDRAESVSLSDPFETLGLEPTFALDPNTLEQRHRELSRALHPDRYGGRPASERQRALGRAIEVNQAFRALKDPIRRAEALLAKMGHAVSEADGARPDPGFLMDVMEQREALGDARRQRDLAKVRSLATAVRAREVRVTAELGSAFAAKTPDVARISALLGELRYHQRFLNEAVAIEDDLDEVRS